jgi:hypothetical protein
MMTMTMTPTATTDSATVDALRPEALVSELCAHGFRALPSSRKGEFLFSRDASTTTPIVAMPVRFSVAADGRVCVQSGFTCGGACLSDNFDSARGRVCAVENFSFGGAKTYIEYREAHRFVSDHVQWTAARVLASLPKFAPMVDRMGLEEALGVLPEYRALSDAPDSSVARLRLLNELARRHLMNVHREVLKFGRGKGIGLENPVFAAASASEEELRALAAVDNATLVHYFDAHLSWRTCRTPTRASPSWPSAAARCGHSSRRLGRTCASGASTLCAASSPRASRTSPSPSSCSTAVRRRSTPRRRPTTTTGRPSSPSPRARRAPSTCSSPHTAGHRDGDSDAAAAEPEALWDRLRTAAPTRRLGRANALVARSLLAPDGAGRQGLDKAQQQSWK